jgi:penicillin-binding protein 1C
VANAYGAMARTVNSYNSNQTYPEIEDFTYIATSGKEKKNSSTSSPIFNAGAAWLTLEALTNLNRPEEIDWQSISSMSKVAWKTGTSYGFRDAWAVGVTPRYLVAVWTGNASGEGRPGLTGARTSAQVMFDLFNLLPQTAWFETPYNELTEAAICRESGLLQGSYCPETSIDTLLIPHKGLQGNSCSYHKRIHLSQDGQFQVYRQCAGERGIMPVSWFLLPPSWAWYYKQQHPAYRSLPPFSPECISGGSGQPMQFIYPYYNATIKLTKQLDGSQGRTIFELAHQNPSTTVYWHLDNDYLGETSDVHQMELSPSKGKHRVTVVDEEGNALGVEFGVE